MAGSAPAASREDTAQPVSSTVPGAPEPSPHDPSGSRVRSSQATARRAGSSAARPTLEKVSSTAAVPMVWCRYQTDSKVPSGLWTRASQPSARRTRRSPAGTPASSRASTACTVVIGHGPLLATLVLRTQRPQDPRVSCTRVSQSTPRRTASACSSPGSLHSTERTSPVSRVEGQPSVPDQPQ